MAKKKLPTDPRRRQQVKTFIELHGREKYSEIGSRGGKPTPASFDSERARAASKISWEKRRARQAETNNQEGQP